MHTRHLFASCLLISLCACASWPVSADTVTATWQNPVENTDGSAIPASGEGSLASARIAWGTCSAPGVFGAERGFITRPMPATAAVFNLAPGDWCVQVTVANTYGVSSIPSNVGVHTTPPPTPRPATNVTVTRSP